MTIPLRWRDRLLGACVAGLLALSLAFAVWPAPSQGGGAPQQAGEAAKRPPEPTPEEKMARRFPQPVQVSRLVGAGILDEVDNVIGRIRTVSRTRDGKIVLVIGLGGLLGFGERLVAVPIEVVGWLGPNLASLDWRAERFELAPTWYASDGATVLEPGETIRVALARR